MPRKNGTTTSKKTIANVAADLVARARKVSAEVKEGRAAKIAKEATALPAYEMRLVAFLDILGFKELVSESTDDPKVLKRLLHVIDAMRSEGADLGEETDKMVTQFSDSIVVSYRVKSRSSAYYLLLDLLLLVIEATQRGVLLRGGISVARLIHTNEHLLGPGMIFAYNAESKIAKYPRVIVEPHSMEFLLHAAAENPADHHDAGTETKYVRDLLTKDDDGNFYLDYISFDGVVVKGGAEPDDYQTYFESIGQLVRDGLTHHDSTVKDKYVWLQKKYAAQLKVFKSSPNPRWKKMNPAAFAFYASLSDHAELAKGAAK